MQIKWKKISQYCIEYNNIYISKYKVKNNYKYVLWHNAKLIKIFESSEEAKNEAMAFIQ
jgi:hypothetical protein